MRTVGRVATVLAIAGCAVTASARGQEPASEGWRPFEGSWSAAGERHTLPVERGEVAAIVRLSGALVLKTGDGLSRGFRAEAIGFDAGRGAGVGRAVWTDERGDRIFSDIAGAPGRDRREVNGTITGGTGRYAGIAGSYRFTWDYLMPADDGRIQAGAVSLAGRYRREGGR